MLDKSFPDDNNTAISQADIAYGVLHSAILSCELAPGFEVSESILAKQYELGKGGIRIALARLRQQGLVNVAARRGYRITPVTLRVVRDIFEMRRILEPASTELAAGGDIDCEQLTNLNAICMTGYQPQDPQNLMTFIRVHRQFHMTIFSAAGNRQIADTLNNLWNQTQRLLNLNQLYIRRPDKMVHDHSELIAALDKGDGDAAKVLAKREIVDLYDLIVEDILNSDNTLEPGNMIPAIPDVDTRVRTTAQT